MFQNVLGTLLTDDALPPATHILVNNLKYKCKKDIINLNRGWRDMKNPYIPNY